MSRTGDGFPWELLKAECLRLVCVQLVEASSVESQYAFKPGRKEEMVAFLNDVYERGVHKALQDVEPQKTIKRTASTAQLGATPSKRKSSFVDGEEDAEGDSDFDDNDNNDNKDEEGYNTRYKGVKRVKVHGPTPEPQEPKPKRKIGRPRKSVVSTASAVEGGVRKRGRPRKGVLSGGEVIKVSKGKGKILENGAAGATAVGEAVIPSISRPRGRPRKNGIMAGTGGVPPKSGPETKPRSANNAPKSKDSAREVFDGIVLVKRNKNGKEKAVGDDDGGDDEAGGDVGNNECVEVPTGGDHNDEHEGDVFEEDAVLAAVNGDAQGDLSSLGGSNKDLT